MVTDNVLGVLLAGGLSSRMGRDKALYHFEGRTLLERTWSLLTSCLSHCVLSVRSPVDGYPVLLDDCERMGPIGALMTALAHAKRCGFSGILALACDMPFLSADLLLSLLSAYDGKALAVCFASAKGQCEPLCAVYASQALPYVQASIAKGVYALRGVLPKEKVVRIVCPEEWAFRFTNINTPSDALRALELKKERKEKGLSE
ncbi:MAG: molybdenum cofactor guanylyltransferase [Desulfovibrionaceae bacterium]|nr:molybdenum cofactor guanylyltransferase [Desulfovibrionaceae bacterium]